MSNLSRRFHYKATGSSLYSGMWQGMLLFKIPEDRQGSGNFAPLTGKKETKAGY